MDFSGQQQDHRLSALQAIRANAPIAPVLPVGRADASVERRDSMIERLANLDDMLVTCHLLAAAIEERIGGSVPTAAAGGSTKQEPRSLGINGLTQNLLESAARLQQRLDVICAALG